MFYEESVPLALSGFVLVIALTALGLGLQLQSELSLNQRAVRGLKAVSLLCFVLVALICLVFGHVLGFLLGMSILGRWGHFQLAQRWARQRAAELELIWLLALAGKSERSLVEEVQMYAGGAIGLRKKRLLAFAADLQSGVPLQNCLPFELFSRSTALQIRSALNSNSFAESLTRVAISQGKSLSDGQQDLGYSILAYPGLLMTVLIGICSFQMYYIIPKFKHIFDDFGTELPDVTMATIRFSDFCVYYWYLIILPIIAVLALIIRNLTKNQHDSEASILMEILGQFFVRMHAPEILRTLSTTISSGQTVTDGVKVFDHQPGAPMIQSTMSAISSGVQHGQSVWNELHVHGVLQSSELKLIEAAGRADNLPWVLETLADNLERRWKFRFNFASAILHPVLILLVSVPIGLFVIAMFMPIIKLLNDLS